MGNPVIDRVATADGEDMGPFKTIPTHDQLRSMQRDLRFFPSTSQNPTIIGLAAQYFCKLPADQTTVAWHQDASYWPLTPSKTVTVWLAIEDVDIDNACMRFVSGSHLQGPIGFRASEAAERNVLDQTVDDVERYGALVDVEVAAGEASIHSPTFELSRTLAGSARAC